ncbi:MAG: RidA family protein [candidate division WOR-3 bacterium]|nr:MAG: RidA family protein [candidate division WOR-3 bacterium]
MKQAVQTDGAPKPIGPYSQAVKYGDLVFTSGQIPVDPGTGKMVEGDIQAQTEQVFRNLEAVLQAAGTSLQNAVKVTVFLADMADFTKVNEVYARQFEEPFPARSSVVSALPARARLEIEVVAGS